MSSRPLVDRRMFVGAHPLFSKLETQDLNDLIAQTSSRKFPTDRVVLCQGESGDEMYIILSGRVRISMHLAEGEDIQLGELGESEAFGEFSLFDHQTRTATVTTCEPCQFLIIDRERLNEFLMSHPAVAIQLLSVMSERLRETSDLIKDSLYWDVSARLANTLTKIGEAYGKNTRKGLEIDVAFSEQELGELAGLPKDLVSAQLGFWQKQGVVKTKRGCLSLIDPDKLMQVQ